MFEENVIRRAIQDDLYILFDMAQNENLSNDSGVPRWIELKGGKADGVCRSVSYRKYNDKKPKTPSLPARRHKIGTKPTDCERHKYYKRDTNVSS